MAIFYVPAVNLIGRGCVNEIGGYVKELGYKKALLVTDEFIRSSDILPNRLTKLELITLFSVRLILTRPVKTCMMV